MLTFLRRRDRSRGDRGFNIAPGVSFPQPHPDAGREPWRRTLVLPCPHSAPDVRLVVTSPSTSSSPLCRFRRLSRLKIVSETALPPHIFGVLLHIAVLWDFRRSKDVQCIVEVPNSQPPLTHSLRWWAALSPCANWDHTSYSLLPCGKSGNHDWRVHHGIRSCFPITEVGSWTARCSN